MKTVTVEFDGALNQQFYFQPLGRTLRGRFDSRRMADAGRLYHEWPHPIPGQTLKINFESGECEVSEPLWKPEHNATREKIESKGMKLPPGTETVTAEPATLFYWLRNSIDAGDCKVIGGDMPSKVDGKPKLRFHSTEQPEPIDRLTAAMEKQNELMAKLLARLEK